MYGQKRPADGPLLSDRTPKKRKKNPPKKPVDYHGKMTNLQTYTKPVIRHNAATGDYYILTNTSIRLGVDGKRFQCSAAIRTFDIDPQGVFWMVVRDTGFLIFCKPNAETLRLDPYNMDPAWPESGFCITNPEDEKSDMIDMVVVVLGTVRMAFFAFRNYQTCKYTIVRFLPASMQSQVVHKTDVFSWDALPRAGLTYSQQRNSLFYAVSSTIYEYSFFDESRRVLATSKTNIRCLAYENKLDTLISSEASSIALVDMYSNKYQVIASGADFIGEALKADRLQDMRLQDVQCAMLDGQGSMFVVCRPQASTLVWRNLPFALLNRAREESIDMYSRGDQRHFPRVIWNIIVDYCCTYRHIYEDLDEMADARIVSDSKVHKIAVQLNLVPKWQSFW